MIYIKDDFLPQELLDRIDEDKSSYEEVVTPGKSFWVKHASTDFIIWICGRISEIEGGGITPILGFFREAKEGQDNDWRIHNDSIIEGQQPDRAAVLYISDSNYNGINGTAFWEHKLYGDTFKDVSPEKFNKLLIEDSNDLDKWTLKSIVGHKKNRLISYPCNYFHSKYPNEFVKSRKVFVIFYKVNK
jgi:hypothetical protein